jgi:hypothetical protein
LSATDYLETSLLNHTFNDPAWTPPGTYYVGLYTGTRSDDALGGLTEVPTAGGTLYARVSFLPADIGAATGTSPVTKTVTAVLTFPEAGASWGTPGFYAVLDAATAGNPLFVQAITTPKPIGAGDTPRIPANTLIFQAGTIISPAA